MAKYEVRLTRPFRASTDPAGTATNGEVLAIGSGSSVRVAAMRAVEKLINAKSSIPVTVTINAYKTA